MFTRMNRRRKNSFKCQLLHYQYSHGESQKGWLRWYTTVKNEDVFFLPSFHNIVFSLPGPLPLHTMWVFRFADETQTLRLDLKIIFFSRTFFVRFEQRGKKKKRPNMSSCLPYGVNGYVIQHNISKKERGASVLLWILHVITTQNCIYTQHNTTQVIYQN